MLYFFKVALMQSLSFMHLIPFETASLQLYSTQQHAGLRFHMHESLDFMQQWLFLPIHRLEAFRLCKQVPILFYKDHRGQISLAALLVNSQGHVVKGSQRCELSYLPVTARLYPFSWIDQDRSSNIAIYSNAPHFKGVGEKLFTSKSKPTQRMRAILKHIAMARAEYQKTQLLLQELVQYVKFKPFVLNKAQNGEMQQIGFLTIDQDNINVEFLTPNLRDLVKIHAESLNLIPVKAEDNPKRSKSISVDDILQKVCDKFAVTEQDISSRKRADQILKARAELAQLSKEYDGMIEQLSERLGRSVSTIKRWSA